MNVRNYCLCLIFAISSVCFCSSQDDNTGTVEIVGGVRYIHNAVPKWGNEPAVSLELIHTYGGDDEEDENKFFSRPDAVEIDKDGNLYVLDGGYSQIQKFDADRNYITTIGRKGEGPGEFNTPLYFEIGFDGTITVIDRTGTTVNRIILDKDGTELKRFRMSEIDFAEFKTLRSGNIIGHFYNNRENPEHILGLFDKNGVLVKPFGQKEEFGDERLTLSGNRVQFAVDDGDAIYVAWQSFNRIDKYLPDGELIWRADRPIGFEPGIIEITTGLGEKRKTPIPVTLRIGMDYKNRIWMVTLTRRISQEDRDREIPPHDLLAFDIFDAEGAYLGQLGGIPHIYRATIIGDRVFTVSLEDASMAEYKIIDK